MVEGGLVLPFRYREEATPILADSTRVFLFLRCLMRFFSPLIFLLVLPTLAWADGPSDLQANLQRLDGHSPVKVNVSYTNWQEATTFINPVTSQGSLQFQVREDGSNLQVDWKLPQLEAVNGEERLLGVDPQAGTPTRDAMKELGAHLIDHLLNQAGELSEFLKSAQFQKEGSELYQGKPARVLEFTFDPNILPVHRGLVSHKEATLKIWVGDDGLPLASETLTDYAGKRARLIGRFHNKCLVKTTYAVLSQRLVVTSRTREELFYDRGVKVQRKKTLSISETA
jgi:hypothetical protein